MIVILVCSLLLLIMGVSGVRGIMNGRVRVRRGTVHRSSSPVPFWMIVAMQISSGIVGIVVLGWLLVDFLKQA
jgi:hypothetical protein